jgi:hypothetical protein
MRHIRRDNGAMLLPVLIVGGVLTVPIPHGAPRAAHACTILPEIRKEARWFDRVRKMTPGCPRDFTMPVGWDRPEGLVLPRAPVSRWKDR